MDYKQIERLVKLIENSSLMQFSFKDGDVEIVMDKKDNPPVVAPAAAAAPMAAMPQMAPAAPAAPEAAEAKAEEEEVFITSPIVATFYSAPAPDAPAFVKVGDRGRSGETVCILEAMKLMNEIQCDWDCEIEAVLVSNEQKVEYGQPLFRVKRL